MNCVPTFRAALAAAVTTALALSGIYGGAQAKGDGRKVVRGGFINPLCAITSVNPDGAFTCTGASIYQGYFSSVNPYTVTGKVSFNTSTLEATATGYALESHRGRKADGSIGSMRTFQTFTQYADGTVIFLGCVLDAAEGWAGTAGTAVADGYNGVGSAAGHGSYRFTLVDPADAAQEQAKCAAHMRAVTTSKKR